MLALALTVALISAGVAVADDLQADGDGLVPFGNNPTVTIGDVCQNDQVSGTVLLAIRRTGAGQVYANNARSPSAQERRRGLRP